MIIDLHPEESKFIIKSLKAVTKMTEEEFCMVDGLIDKLNGE